MNHECYGLLTIRLFPPPVRIPLYTFGDIFIRRVAEEIPLSHFDNVVHLLSSLFSENPIPGVRLSLRSSFHDGIVIFHGPPGDEVETGSGQRDFIESGRRSPGEEL